MRNIAAVQFEGEASAKEARLEGRLHTAVFAIPKEASVDRSEVSCVGTGPLSPTLSLKSSAEAAVSRPS